MAETRIAQPSAHPGRMKLEPYSAEIRLAHLTLGIDNIHYDVFLSPKFVEFTRKYLLDLLRQVINVSTGPPNIQHSANYSARFCRNR